MSEKLTIPLYPKKIRRKGLSHLTRNKEKLETEQLGLQEINCPKCNEECWISAKKRKAYSETGGEIICWNCILDSFRE